MSHRPAAESIRLPDFLIAGVWKCGSTTVWQQLEGHPDVVTATRKEPAFFDWHFEEGPEFYRSLLPPDAGPGAFGEATVGYFVSREAPTRIHDLIPDVRLVFLLRDPVDRAVSHFYWNQSIGKDVPSLDEAIAVGVTRPEFNPSRYGTYLHNYLDVFPADQVLVVLTEDLRSDLAGSMERIHRHIGVDAARPLTGSQEVNTAVVARSPAMARVLNRGRKRLQRAGARRPDHPWLNGADKALRGMTRLNRRSFRKPPLRPDQRERLLELFLPEIEQTEAMLGLDLSAWKGAGREADPGHPGGDDRSGSMES